MSRLGHLRSIAGALPGVSSYSTTREPDWVRRIREENRIRQQDEAVAGMTEEEAQAYRIQPGLARIGGGAGDLYSRQNREATGQPGTQAAAQGQWNDLYSAMGGPEAARISSAQIAAPGSENFNQVNQQQQQLANALRAQAAGTAGPSLAQQQLQQARDANISSAMGMAASQRGLAQGAQARNLGRTVSQFNAGAARDSAMLRAQEQQQAQAQLAQLLGGMQQGNLGHRGQNIGVATGQAGLDQQATLANQQGLFNALGGSSEVNMAGLDRASEERMAQAQRNYLANEAATGRKYDLAAAFLSGGTSIGAAAAGGG